MLKNYLKVIVQNLIRNKTYSLINILGLSTGLAVCLVIIQYVRFEQSYDKFHLNHENKYRVILEFKRPSNSLVTDAANYAPAAVAMKNDFPEVKNYVRITPEYSRVVFERNEKTFEVEKVYYADSTFFSFFNYGLIEGDVNAVLRDVGSVVLSLSEAEKLFGPRNTWKQSPLNQTILMNNMESLMVAGIMKDFPANSHFKAKAIISFSTFVKNNDPNANWGWYDFYTYIELANGTDHKMFEAKLPALLKKYKPHDSQDRMVLQPLAGIHLYSNVGFELNPNGNAQTVYFLSIIALVILVIAWVNYINLATARAESRAREIGVRKVNGASRWEVMKQFILESFIMNLLALVLGIAMVTAALPVVSALLERPLNLSLLRDHQFQLYVVAMYVCGSIISGLYPAVVLSSFKPVSVFKSSSSSVTSGNTALRQGLVIFQFMISAGLICGTMIIHNQLNFMQHKDLGFNHTNTLVINAPTTLPNDSVFFSSYRSFKNILQQYSSVEKVTVASALPGKSYNDLDTQGATRMINDSEEVNHAVASYRVDEDFFDVLDIKFLAGHKFYESQLNRNNIIVVNRKAAELLGYSDPSEIVGKKLITNGNKDYPKEIIGVIENYHHKSLKNNFEPTVIGSEMFHMLYIVLKLSGSQTSVQQTISSIQEKWAAMYPSDPFIYSFLDEHVNDQYKADIQFGRIFSIFSGFSIFIACLGLFALVSYSISVRIKEIGIRKVLGATLSHILLLFTKGYVRLLLIAFTIGLPLSYYVLNLWIHSFAYKAPLNWWLFLAPAVVVSCLALVTVSFQIVKAALINPVESLRSD